MPSPVPTEDDCLLRAEGISKRFGSVQALDAATLTLRKGRILALCGENGAGKSTLVKILMGVHTQDEGTITIEGRAVRIDSPQTAQALGVALVSQELSLAPDLTVQDNVLLGYNQVPLFHRRAVLRQKAAAAIAALGWNEEMLDRRVGSLSIAERQLVEIARNLCRDARILILDEPTATLPDLDIVRLFDALRRLSLKDVAILYITHRLNEVFDLCDTAAVMRNGRVVETAPTTATDYDQLVEMMLGSAIDSVYPEGAAGAVPCEPLLAVSGLSVPGAVAGIDFNLYPGRILGLAGQIGSGAAETGRALAGLIAGARAALDYRGQPMPLRAAPFMAENGFAFISEDRANDGIFTDQSVSDNLSARVLRTMPFVVNRAAMRRRALTAAARAGIDTGRIDSRAAELSGGNQQKIAFARCLKDGATTDGMGGVLIMNEPTRGVDVGARSEIYRLMRDFCAAGYAVLMQSTDLEELVGMSDDLVTLNRGRIAGRHRRPGIDIQKVLGEITHAEERRSMNL